MNPDVLVVVATYNEMGNIERLVEEVLSASDEVDVLVVDDGSPDGTGDWVEGKSREEPRVHLLRRAGKLGYGTAQAAGMAWALERGYGGTLSMDADFSHSPSVIPEFLRNRDRYDFIIGSRYVPGGRTVNWGLHRRLLSRCGNLFAKAALGVKANDLTTGFRYLSRRAIERIDFNGVKMEGYGFLIETNRRVQKAGFATREIPITFVDRQVGQSKISQQIVFEAFWMALRILVVERILRFGKGGSGKP